MKKGKEEMPQDLAVVEAVSDLTVVQVKTSVSKVLKETNVDSLVFVDYEQAETIFEELVKKYESIDVETATLDELKTARADVRQHRYDVAAVVKHNNSIRNREKNEEKEKSENLVSKIESLEDELDQGVKKREDQKAREKEAKEQKERERIASINKAISEYRTEFEVLKRLGKTQEELATLATTVNNLKGLMEDGFFGEFLFEAQDIEEGAQEIFEIIEARIQEEKALEQQRQEQAEEAKRQEEEAARMKKQQEELDRRQKEADERDAKAAKEAAERLNKIVAARSLRVEKYALPEGVFTELVKMDDQQFEEEVQTIDLRHTRTELLKPFNYSSTDEFDVAEMTQPEFENFLHVSKDKFESNQAAEKKAKADAEAKAVKEAEKAKKEALAKDKEEQKRIAAIQKKCLPVMAEIAANLDEIWKILLSDCVVMQHATAFHQSVNAAFEDLKKAHHLE